MFILTLKNSFCTIEKKMLLSRLNSVYLTQNLPQYASGVAECVENTPRGGNRVRWADPRALSRYPHFEMIPHIWGRKTDLMCQAPQRHQRL